MARNLQHPLGYYQPFMEEAVEALVTGQQQERFSKDLGKVRLLELKDFCR